MQQRFSALPHIRQKLDYVLQVPFRFDSFGYVVPRRFHLILSSCVLDDFFLLHRLDKSMINPNRYAVPVRNSRKDCLFVRCRRIFPNRPSASVAVAYDIMIDKKLDRTRRDTVKKILRAYQFLFLCRYLFLSHPLLPPSHQNTARRLRRGAVRLECLRQSITP